MIQADDWHFPYFFLEGLLSNELVLRNIWLRSFTKADRRRETAWHSVSYGNINDLGAKEPEN